MDARLVVRARRSWAARAAGDGDSSLSHRCFVSVDQFRRRCTFARSRAARGRTGRGLPDRHRQAWLGHDLPTWSTPCPIKVKLTDGEAGGLTSFGFTQGRVTDQSMTVEGRLDRILASALPHEVTHTIFASYFGGPMPRWADEGASLLSEDDRERRRHDKIAVDLLARRGEVPLARLFVIEDYPKDLMSFYGQGYSISRFLIEMGGRPRFLRFVRDGLKDGWDPATRIHYQLANVRELDRAWRSWHRVTLQAARTSSSDDMVASRPRGVEFASPSDTN